MLTTSIGRLRFIGYLEGLSFLVLLGIAMPLKYMADIPEPVTWTGIIHGALFTVYLLAIAWTLLVRKLTFKEAFLGVVAAFLPFGPFFMDRKLRAKE